jgi:DNA gyrase/topoisomerase IV subunit A
VPLADAQRLDREHQPALSAEAMLGLRAAVLARSADDVIALTNHGRGHILPVSEIPELEGPAWPVQDDRVSGDTERVSVAAAVGDWPRFWTIVTRRGYVRQHIRVAFDRALLRGEQVVSSPLARDEPRAIASGDQGDLLVVSRWGFAVRFPQRTIASQGSRATELDSDDEVVAALRLTSECELLFLTSAGLALRRHSADVRSSTAPGGAGHRVIKAFDLLAVFPYEPEARLVFLTYSGHLVSANASGAPLRQQLGKGSPMRDLAHDPAVAVVCVPAEMWPTA